MKEVREERFTKREDVGFNPAPIPETPLAAAQDGGQGERANERTHAVRVPVLESAPTYVVTIPATRRKTRQSFDIFEDQYDALKKLQLAEADQAGSAHGRKMGDMVQEALDTFIKEKANKIGTIRIHRQHE